ncbi:hypothetical protein ACXC9Q_32365 [Kribbella sp. CWNU-51]
MSPDDVAYEYYSNAEWEARWIEEHRRHMVCAGSGSWLVCRTLQFGSARGNATLVRGAQDIPPIVGGRAYLLCCWPARPLSPCLTCPVFITTPDFLAEHLAQLRTTKELIITAQTKGNTRLAEMNQRVAANLENIIDTIQAPDVAEADDAS